MKTGDAYIHTWTDCTEENHLGILEKALLDWKNKT